VTLTGTNFVTGATVSFGGSAATGVSVTSLTTLIATTPEECSKAAAGIGFPVAIKILSHDITHKSDVGGIALNVRSAPEAANQFIKITERVQTVRPEAATIGVSVQAMSRGGYEIIIGSKKDPTFGPALMFGMGGTGVELYRDVVRR
jgi:acyl-CoA synthetase (NDP forming)